MILTRYKRMRFAYRRGAGTAAVLLTLMLFSFSLLAVSRWLTAQQRDGLQIYQQYQALLLAQNQFARQRLGLGCETPITQNQIRFDVQCQAQRVKVRFPLGEISLSAENR
ncbi:DUF5374 domain-containing protein [Testudinibacter sp. P80/BLE/0925]|uniref:DUF5374 domain-containing protein n=1 Tax=Testudinibacter sp. TW-1 TaxID=3417757 RepID=UPI003D3611B0